MDILLLGGYRFLGRALIDAAHARGHAVTAFNRGNHPPLADVEHVTGDRDDLGVLAGRRWDAAIDTSGYIPRHARLAGTTLRDAVERYAFVSSVSVYPFPIAPDADESTQLAALAPGAAADGPPDDNYGARKALCERELETLLPGRVFIVRPGFIVGPHDYTDRFNSWIERAARDGPLIVPEDPAAPIQLIDVRDLAVWIVAMLERGEVGPYNATGPERPLRLGDIAQTCIDVTGSRATATTISAAGLQAAGVEPWTHIPFWVEPEHTGIMQINIDKALAAGLQFRPLASTVADTAAWLRESDHERRVVFPPELERAAVEAVKST